MKKVILLVALALMGASALKGMEVPSEEVPSYQSLPKELKQEIIDAALETSNSLSDAIKTIQAMGMMHGIQYDNFKDVTTLVTALENKFPNKSRAEIIETLNKQELLKGFKLLLPKNKNEIIKMTLASSDTLEEAIEAIRVASILQGIQYDTLFNLKDFTTLVHLLADKFNSNTTDVAKMFATPIAEKYLNLGESLVSSVLNNELEKVTQLIEQGADINFSTYPSLIPLDFALGSYLYESAPEQIAMLKLLLKHNARLWTAAEFPSVLNQMELLGTEEEVQQFIKEAMENKQ